MGNEEYKKIVDKQSHVYDKGRFKHYFTKVFNNFLRIIPKGKSVLDAGSGTGLYTIKLIKNGRPAVGVDYSKNMIDISKRNARRAGVKANFILCDIEKKIPLKKKFDYVLFAGNWEYFENPEKVLLNVKNVLNEGGRVIISTHNIFAFPIIFLLEKLKLKLAPAFWHFNSVPGRVKRLAKKTGFKLEKTMLCYYGLDRFFILQK